MREWLRVFCAILKDVCVRHSKQSSSAFEKGTGLLAYCVELNIHFADSQPNWQGVVAHRTCTQWLSAWNMSGIACSCRMRACPPIIHLRRWLCSLPWHACVHVHWVIGQEYTVRASHPKLLCAVWFTNLVWSFFWSLQSLSLFFWKQTAKFKKT